jgi:hypothetical protein
VAFSSHDRRFQESCRLGWGEHDLEIMPTYDAIWEESGGIQIAEPNWKRAGMTSTRAVMSWEDEASGYDDLFNRPRLHGGLGQ